MNPNQNLTEGGALPFAIVGRYLELLPEVERECRPDPGTEDAHLRWMLSELITMNDTEKAMRWLGFIQGVLIMKGYTDVETERNFTRPFFKQDD